jgi:hypothetical protein
MIEYASKETFDYTPRNGFDRVHKHGLLMPPDIVSYDRNTIVHWPSVWAEFFGRLNADVQYPRAIYIYRVPIGMSARDSEYSNVRFYNRYGDSLFVHTYQHHYVFESIEIDGLKSLLDYLDFRAVATTEEAELYFKRGSE